MDSILASKRVRAFRARHRIQPIEVDGQEQCEHDGFRIYKIRNGTYRHDISQVERFVQTAGTALH